ncbi:MAG: membrane protein insertion efficiency factor YidD [Candidatus Kerfeldbacteria bacterium CG15_BIG_FIL_POST_REV_8_21_14_020_45_12]|uniref:Putative membrane protein insertion efficiency factor n=1 Tax=Candidatus Kerfeldbacteria bacterium CG15_BIG_FIL_POST_REV_8_21_14_020_45_12 TaxID=2014247 RepID=A0A2M7H410_9BACT|nr:MAG: membrane protein insertion efficiency factor YidD [Candidatus Kerfeldbacteria bacterium CG15_BIG_FIL_POST_REV_8_21_14_020_45_12]
MKKLILKLISLYKRFLSPVNRGIYSCRFTPSCADYTKEAVEKYGVIKGGLMGFWRVLRCNPWNKGGEDPVR